VIADAEGHIAITRREERIKALEEELRTKTNTIRVQEDRIVELQREVARLAALQEQKGF
jgi:hypothetical protein